MEDYQVTKWGSKWAFHYHRPDGKKIVHRFADQMKAEITARVTREIMKEKETKISFFLSEILEGHAAHQEKLGERATTTSSRNSAIRRILSTLGDMPWDLCTDPLVESKFSKWQGRTFNNHLRYLQAAFRWARRKGMIPDELTGPERVEPRRVEFKMPDYLTVDAYAQMIQATKPQFLATLVLGGMAGLRPEEYCSTTKDVVRWSDLKEEGIFIRPEVSKTGSPRLVPFNPGLRRGLELVGNADGFFPQERICKHRTRITHRETARLQKLGLPWGHDILRHSYGTYRMAQLRDLGRVATEMGNSASVVRRHYDGVVGDFVDSDRWFNATIFAPIGS